MGLGREEGPQPKNPYTSGSEKNSEKDEQVLKFLSKLKFELAHNRTK